MSNLVNRGLVSALLMASTVASSQALFDPAPALTRYAEGDAAATRADTLLSNVASAETSVLSATIHLAGRQAALIESQADVTAAQMVVATTAAALTAALTARSASFVSLVDTVTVVITGLPDGDADAAALQSILDAYNGVVTEPTSTDAEIDAAEAALVAASAARAETAIMTAATATQTAISAFDMAIADAGNAETTLMFAMTDVERGTQEVEGAAAPLTSAQTALTAANAALQTYQGIPLGAVALIAFSEDAVETAERALARSVLGVEGAETERDNYVGALADYVTLFEVDRLNGGGTNLDVQNEAHDVYETFVAAGIALDPGTPASGDDVFAAPREAYIIALDTLITDGVAELQSQNADVPQAVVDASMALATASTATDAEKAAARVVARAYIVDNVVAAFQTQYANAVEAEIEFAAQLVLANGDATASQAYADFIDSVASLGAAMSSAAARNAATAVDTSAAALVAAIEALADDSGTAASVAAFTAQIEAVAAARTAVTEATAQIATLENGPFRATYEAVVAQFEVVLADAQAAAAAATAAAEQAATDNAAAQGVLDAAEAAVEAAQMEADDPSFAAAVVSAMTARDEAQVGVNGANERLGIARANLVTAETAIVTSATADYPTEVAAITAATGDDDARSAALMALYAAVDRDAADTTVQVDDAITAALTQVRSQESVVADAVTAVTDADGALTAAQAAIVAAETEVTRVANALTAAGVARTAAMTAAETAETALTAAVAAQDAATAALAQRIAEQEIITTAENDDTSPVQGLSRALRAADNDGDGEVDVENRSVSAELLNTITNFNTRIAANTTQLGSNSQLLAEIQIRIAANATAIASNADSIARNSAAITLVEGELLALRGGVAMAVALSGLPQLENKVNWSIFGGVFEDEVAIATSLNVKLNDTIAVGLGVAHTSSGPNSKIGFNAGVSIGF